ncbi:IS110 family transposase [Fodinicurvata fenggangensis]|uniref:IS110 family transposase n=1 Tax=Fodinicurvata fenggangensis TaxID=1121830 RepID=UPI000554D72D|nr:IS110 family transposase [Fodinicurvata fenggangensis]
MIATSIAGIDIAKHHLDVHLLPSGKRRRFPANKLPQLVAWLQQCAVELAVAEATGGFEVELIEACQDAGLALAVANPRHIRHFARGMGLLAKTDRLDARVLALYGERVQPQPTAPLSADRRRLVALLRRRRQLTAMRTAEQQRWHQEREADLKEELEQTIAQLTARVRTLEAHITRHIRQSPELAADAQRLSSIPGIGPVLTATLLAGMPELGQASRRQVATLAGLAPHAWDTGTLRGQRRIWGGRQIVRNALYMGAVAAVRGDNAMRRRYLRLKENGKSGKAALVAVMRHMVIVANAMLRDGTNYQPV